MARKKRKAARKRVTAPPSPNGQPAEKLPVGALVPQPHGGALRNGGPNKGGTGRPPEYLRLRSREVYEKWLDWAEKQVGVKKPDPDLMIQIGKTSGRFGFPAEDSVSRQYVRELLQKQIDVILATLPANDAERLIAALHPV